MIKTIQTVYVFRDLLGGLYPCFIFWPAGGRYPLMFSIGNYFSTVFESQFITWAVIHDLGGSNNITQIASFRKYKIANLQICHFDETVWGWY